MAVHACVMFSISGKASIGRLLLDQPVERVVDLDCVQSLFVRITGSQKAENRECRQACVRLAPGEVAVNSVFIHIHATGTVVGGVPATIR